MKTIIALLALMVAFGYAQSTQADGQRSAIDRKWKAAQEWQEQQNKRFKTIDKQIDKFEKDQGNSSKTNLKAR